LIALIVLELIGRNVGLKEAGEAWFNFDADARLLGGLRVAIVVGCYGVLIHEIVVHLNYNYQFIIST